MLRVADDEDNKRGNGSLTRAKWPHCCGSESIHDPAGAQRKLQIGGSQILGVQDHELGVYSRRQIAKTDDATFVRESCRALVGLREMAEGAEFRTLFALVSAVVRGLVGVARQCSCTLRLLAARGLSSIGSRQDGKSKNRHQVASGWASTSWTRLIMLIAAYGPGQRG